MTMPTQSDAWPELQRELRFEPIVNACQRHLSPAQIRQYNELGYIHPLEVYTPAEAAGNRAYFDWLMEQAAAKGWNSYGINGWQMHCERIYQLVVEPRILDYVQDLLGETLVCWGTHYFCKLPGDMRRVSWHQDA